MRHCLVSGATGYMGSRLVAALSRAGVRVTATGRDPKRLESFDFPPAVGRVLLDVSDRCSCAAAFRGAAAGARGPVDVAYFLVHSIGEGDFARQDLASARRVRHQQR